MTPAEFEKVRAEFLRLSGLGVAERAAAIVDLKALDPRLGAEVESLLAHDHATASTAAWQAPAIPTPTPLKIGRYKIASSLPSGGMGEVFLGVRDDDQFHKRVAIKLIRKGMDSAEILGRFELERQVLSAMNHPNIARLLDAGEAEDGRPYFVMEYVDGMPLLDYADAQHATTAERLRLLIKICSAVAHAHANLVLHRDLKPSNILVTPQGEPKLLDFGIAKILNPDLIQSPVVTRPRHGPMTPEYASPEQIRGDPLTTASDVYTLGVLMYELMTGSRPYVVNPSDPAAAMRVICEQDPPAPSTVVTRGSSATLAGRSGRTRTPEELAKAQDTRPGELSRRLSGDLDNIVLKAMRKSPQRRYPGADAMARDIEDHLAGRPVSARPETWTYVFNKFVKRNRVPVAAVATVMVVLAGAVVVVGGMARRLSEKNGELEKTQADLTKSKHDMTQYANELLSNLARGIQNQTGSLESRRLLVKTSITAFEKLEAMASESAELRSLVCEGYEQLAMLAGGVGSGNDGRDDEAIKLWGKAIEMRRAEVSRGSAVAKLLLAESLWRRASSQWRINAMGDAVSRDLDEAEKLLTPESGSPTPLELSLWARISTLRGDVLKAKVSPGDGASAAWRHAVQIYDGLIAHDPKDKDARRDRLSVRTKIARAQSDVAGLLELADERRRLAAATPSDGTLARDVVNAQYSLADELSNAGQHEEADREAEFGVEAARRNRASDPSDARLQEDFVRVVELLCVIRSEMKLSDEKSIDRAIALATEAEAVARSWSQTSGPQVVQTARVARVMGKMLLLRRRLDEASDALTRAAEDYDRALRVYANSDKRGAIEAEKASVMGLMKDVERHREK